jgi:hypothetical protein
MRATLCHGLLLSLAALWACTEDPFGAAFCGQGGVIEDLRITDLCGSVEAGQPIVLDAFVRNGECWCNHSLGCAVDVDGQVIDVTTAVCTPQDLCGACFVEVEGTCALPALDAGRYELRVNGERAADLDVGAGRTACWDLAPVIEPPGEGATCEPRESFPSVELCLGGIDGFGAPRTHFTVTDTCGSCLDRAGGCRVERDDQTLRLYPEYLTCDCPTCGDCPAVCLDVEVECTPERLEPGTYRVEVPGSGLAPQTLVVDPVDGFGAERCVTAGG